MKLQKNIKNIIILLIFSSILFFVYKANTKTDVSLITAKTTISAKQLTSIYSKSENKTDDFYKNEVIKVTGTVKEISYLNNKTTIILHGVNTETNIICELSNDQKKDSMPKVNETITIKGICKGFLKDVILLNSKLIKQ